MKIKKVLLGGLTGGFAYFFLGWFVYGVLLSDFSKTNYNQCAARSMGDMGWISLIISSLAYGFLLSVIFSWSGIKGLLTGLKSGFVLGLLIALTMDLGVYAMSTTFLSVTAVCIDMAIYTVMAAVIGAIVAVVMGAGEKKN